VMLNELTDSFDVIVERDTDTLILRSGDRRHYVIIGLRSDARVGSQTFLCMMPCTRTLYELHSTESSTALMNDILLNLKARLIGRANVKNYPSGDDVLTSVVHSTAILPTRTGLTPTMGIWLKMPVEFKGAFAGTVLAFILLIVIMSQQKGLGIVIDVTGFLEMVIILIVAMFVEILIPLGQEMRERKAKPPTQ